MMDKYMAMALASAKEGYIKGEGGPFGAVIVRDGEILAVAHNQVLLNNDPTAHAEINAIRQACAKIGSYDLTGAVIYATGEPCPMCLSAIIWAKIAKCYYANSVADAEKIGFRDGLIYNYLRGETPEILSLVQIDSTDCMEIYEDYAKLKDIIY